jgi:hypothetical protein
MMPLISLPFIFLFQHTNSTTYYPQGNDQVKSTNKVIRLLLTKLMNKNCMDWDEHLHTILFSLHDNFQGLHKSYSFSVGVWITYANAYRIFTTCD